MHRRGRGKLDSIIVHLQGFHRNIPGRYENLSSYWVSGINQKRRIAWMIALDGGCF